MSQNSGKVAGLLARLEEKLPDQRVGLAPSDAFFTRKVDLPEDLPWADKLAFIELSLESNAPFPMDQLAWGFLLSGDTNHAFVYATPRSRLKSLGIDLAEAWLQVFPGFISLPGPLPSSPAIRFFARDGILSAVHLPAHSRVPEKIISRKVRAELVTDEALLEARNRMLPALDTSVHKPEDGLWIGGAPEVQPNDSLRFPHRHLAGGTPESPEVLDIDLSENELWAADLRDSMVADRERRTRRRSRLIWKSLRFAALLAVLFLVLQAGSFALSGYNVYQKNRIAGLEPEATRVENKLTLAQRLTQSTEEDLKPFLLMEAINPLRSDSIYYDKVRSQAFNQLEIDGQSSEGVTPVNAFADSIKQLPYVDEVVNNSRTRNNLTSFEFLITFAELPPEPEGGFVIPDEDAEDEDSGEEES